MVDARWMMVVKLGSGRWNRVVLFHKRHSALLSYSPQMFQQSLFLRHKVADTCPSLSIVPALVSKP